MTAFPEVESRPFAAISAEAEVDVEHEHQELVPAVEHAGDLVEWTPERAAALVRGFGLALHTFDPAANLEGGDALWRATAQEAQEIGEPLSRILARYEPARRLAGVVDEAEMGAAFVSYAKRNMRDRGRLVMRAKAEGELGGETD